MSDLISTVFMNQVSPVSLTLQRPYHVSQKQVLLGCPIWSPTRSGHGTHQLGSGVRRVGPATGVHLHPVGQRSLHKVASGEWSGPTGSRQEFRSVTSEGRSFKGLKDTVLQSDTGRTLCSGPRDPSHETREPVQTDSQYPSDYDHLGRSLPTPGRRRPVFIYSRYTTHG